MAEPLKINRAAIVPAPGSVERETYSVYLELSRRSLTATEREEFTKVKATYFDLVEVPEQGSAIILHGTTIEKVRDNRAHLSKLVRTVGETSTEVDAARAAEVAAWEATKRAEADRRRSIADSISFDD